MQTVVHVTHEAIHKIGGIGAVLHGLFTARTYLDTVKRNILVGPFWPTDAAGESRLGSDGEVLFSSLDPLPPPRQAQHPRRPLLAHRPGRRIPPRLGRRSALLLPRRPLPLPPRRQV